LFALSAKFFRESISPGESISGNGSPDVTELVSSESRR
jgi:hypothetical protein